VPSNDWLGGLTALGQMRQAAGESTYREHKERGFANDVLVPSCQWALLLLMLLFIVAGLALMAWAFLPGAGLMDLAIAGLLTLLACGIVAGLLARAWPSLPGFLQVLIALVAAILVLAVISHNAHGWPALRFWLGACATVASGVFALWLVRAFTDPLWPTSPYEKATLPELKLLLAALADWYHGNNENTVPRIIPYQVNGETHATSAAPANPVPLAREDARLLDFLTIAMTRQIDAPTRRKMRADDGMKHFTLSQCKEPLNREVYEAIIADLMTWGFVEVRPGAGASWKVPPAEAYRVLAAEVERRRVT